MQHKHILVVDDDRMNLEIISQSLEDSGCALTLAEEGEIACALLDDGNSYDVIIIDRMLPGIDGIEVLRRIKSDPRQSATPVIMQTSASTPEQVCQGLEAGARYYLTKPFEPASLRAIVRAALEDGAARAELMGRVKAHLDVLRLATQGSYALSTLAEASELAAFLARLCPAPERAAMGLSELLVNAIEHGNLGIGYLEKGALKRADAWEDEIERRTRLPENAGKRVRVAFERNAGDITFTITDCGRGFDWTAYLEPSPARAFDLNGRGITVARQVAFERLEYIGDGSTVVARVGVPALA